MIKLCIIELKNWNTYLKTTVEDTIDEAIVHLIGVTWRDCLLSLCLISLCHNPKLNNT